MASCAINGDANARATAARRSEETMRSFMEEAVAFGAKFVELSR